jgi:predicted nucleotidyltransferase
MDKYSEILSSFKVQDTLNPKIWDDVESSPKLKSDIRERLLEIAYQFVDFLGVDIVVSDIIMTGSLSNFNWSKFSDVDLHIVANYNQFPPNQVDLYKELFNLKKIIFNEKHDITIFGYDVELYVQDEAETHFSSGVYSVLFDEWANEPKKESVSIDKEKLKSKSKQWMEIIDGVLENAKDEDIETAKSIVKKYKDKLKKYRTCGLEKNGEYSYENLVFKILRRNGYIEKLHNFGNEFLDKKLSLK